MQPVRAAVAVLLAGVLAVGTAQGRTLDQVPGYLKQEGNFVAIPALALGGLGMGVGGLIGLPGSLIAAPIGFVAGDLLGYALVPPAVTAVGGAELGYHLGGAIPWVLKNAFYDAPMQGIARIRGQPASGLVAEVQPVQLDPTRIQYLASTPPRERIPVAQENLRSSALPPPRDSKSLVLLKRRISPFKPPPGTPGGGPLVARAPSLAAPAVALPRPALSVPPPPVVPAAPLSPVARVEPVAPPLPVLPRPVAPLPVAPVPVAPVAAPAVVPPPAVLAPVVPATPVAPEAAEAAPVPAAVAEVPPPAVAAAVAEPPPAVVVAEPAPVAGRPEPKAADTGGAAERPSLQGKKKRKFSERFSF